MNSAEDAEVPVLEQEVLLRLEVGGRFQSSLSDTEGSGCEKEEEEGEGKRVSINIQLEAELPSGETVGFQQVSSHGDGDSNAFQRSFSVEGEQTVVINEAAIRSWVEKKCVFLVRVKAVIQKTGQDVKEWVDTEGGGEKSSYFIVLECDQFWFLDVEGENVEVDMKFDGSEFVLGDKKLSQTWPDGDLLGMPQELSFLEEFHVSVEVFKMMPVDTEEQQTQIRTALMSEALARKLNPMLIRVLKAECLPDAPATKELLDAKTFPVTLKYRISDQNLLEEHQGRVTPWVGMKLDEPSNPVSVRDCIFGVSDLYLLSDLPPQCLLDRACTQAIQFEVHDRTALPEEQELIAQNSTASMEANAQVGDGKGDAEAVGPSDDDEGYVCGVATVSLIDLFRGSRRMDVDASLLPKSTIRGAASLQWESRPGRYLQVHSTLSLMVRLAVPLTQMEAQESPPASVFGRCVFVFDLGDNEMFHAVEDTVRHQNALELKMLENQKSNESDKSHNTKTKATSLTELRSEVDGALTMHTLQSLSMTKLTDDQAVSRDLDVLTGFHVISGKERIIVIEGLAEKAMKRMEDVAHLALVSGNPPERMGETLRERKILLNPAIRYKSRLYASWGVSLRILKLRLSIQEILSHGQTFAGVNAASPDCVRGICCLQNLRNIKWSRQAHDLYHFPTAHMMYLVDKKFGGQLTKEEVLGTSSTAPSRKPSSDETHDHSGRKEQSSMDDEHPGVSAKTIWKAPLDMSNSEFECAKKEADLKRSRRDFIADNIEYLHLLEADSKRIKEQWLTWNRNPNALVYLLDSVDDTTKLLVKRKASDVPDGIARKEGETVKGTHFPHPKEFRWPYPRDPETFNQHSKRPSSSRIQELREPWVEGRDNEASALNGKPPNSVDFVLHFKTNGLFEESVSSVHLCGDGLERERLAAVAAAIEEWESKVVVTDRIFRTVCTTRKHVNQVDKMETMLKGAPEKHGLKMVHSKTAPISMFAEQVFEPPLNNIKREVDPSQFTSTCDFKHNISMKKSDVHKMKHTPS